MEENSWQLCRWVTSPPKTCCNNFPKAPTSSIVNCTGGLHGTNGGNSSSWLAPIDEGAHFKVLTLGILREPEDFIKDASEMGTSKACVCKSSHLDEGSSGGSFSFRPLQDRASKYRQCTQAVLRIFLACVQL